MKNTVENQALLMYDGTLLAHLFSKSNSDRTGVFFVVYNTFLQLMKQNLYRVVVCAYGPMRADVERAVNDLGYPTVKVVGYDNLPTEKYDIYLSPFFPPPDYYMSQSTAARYMILHDVTPLALPEIETPNEEWFNRLEKSLNGEDYYFANSEYTKRDFLRFYPVLQPSHIKVSYLGASEKFYRCDNQKKIDKVKSKYGIPLNVPYIFSLCTLQPRKNLVHAVKCFARFVSENNIDDLCFVLGGHQDEFIGIMNREIESLGSISSRIIKTGYIEDDDLAMLYSGAMFTVYVSLYEGFGLPVLEAMQCGCPVITSNITSMPEVIGDTGITVDPRDPVALRKAYKKMYTDASFRKNCSKRGMERARSFSWEKFINTILSGIDATWRQAVADNEEKLKIAVQSKHKGAIAGGGIRLFGKVWTEKRTTFYFLGIPVARKDKSLDKHVIKVFGFPLIKKVFNYYVATIYLGPIPIKRRPNYAYLESQIDLYTGSLGHALLQLKDRIERNALQSRQIDDMKSIFNDRIQTVRAYQLVKEVEQGKMTLKDDLRQIDSRMVKSAPAEEGDN